VQVVKFVDKITIFSKTFAIFDKLDSFCVAEQLTFWHTFKSRLRYVKLCIKQVVEKKIPFTKTHQPTADFDIKKTLNK